MESTFVSIGEYPEHRGEGTAQLNLIDCGLRYVPKVHNITAHNNNCYANKYNSNIVIDYRVPIDVPSPQQRVYLGTNVEIGEAPWVVLVYDEKAWYTPWNPNFICAGVLITLEWVLTSAHCIEPRYVFIKYLVNNP